MPCLRKSSGLPITLERAQAAHATQDPQIVTRPNTTAVLPTPVPAMPAAAPTHGTEPCIGDPECFTVDPLSILWRRVVDDRERPLSTFSWTFPLPAARLDATLPPSSPVPVASPVGLADGPKPRVGTFLCRNVLMETLSHAEATLSRS